MNKARIARKFEVQYDSNFGFRMSLKRLHGLPEEYKGKVPFIVSSLVPPGRMFQAQPSVGPDISVFHLPEFTSKWNSITYTDEFNFIGL